MLYLLNKAYKNATMVIAQTPEMKYELIEFHKLDKNKIEVILNPIDTSLIDKKTQNELNPYSSENNVNIVAAGRLARQKGFDTLIKAFAYVVRKNVNFKLYIIGNNAGEEVYLRQLVSQLDLENTVYFLGFQENPYKFFKYADAYVLSSRWEGLPNTVLENLYLKKPIIATRCIPFMEELIKDKKNGLLIDVDNIEELSNAILNYKIINVEHSSVVFNNQKFELLFQRLIH
jgi:glycosyltransferase involved in cell wall biosynthesis